MSRIAKRLGVVRIDSCPGAGFYEVRIGIARLAFADGAAEAQVGVVTVDGDYAHVCCPGADGVGTGLEEKR